MGMDMDMDLKLTNIEIDNIKCLIRTEVADKDMVTFRELFGRESNYSIWVNSPLMPLYTNYGDVVGAQIGGSLLREVLMVEQKGRWETIKQAFSNRKDDNEITVYFRHG